MEHTCCSPCALIGWFLTKYGENLAFICKLTLILIIILSEEVIIMRKICYILLAMFSNILQVCFSSLFWGL